MSGEPRPETELSVLHVERLPGRRLLPQLLLAIILEWQLCRRAEWWVLRSRPRLSVGELCAWQMLVLLAILGLLQNLNHLREWRAVPESD